MHNFQTSNHGFKWANTKYIWLWTDVVNAISQISNKISQLYIKFISPVFLCNIQDRNRCVSIPTAWMGIFGRIVCMKEDPSNWRNGYHAIPFNNISPNRNPKSKSPKTITIWKHAKPRRWKWRESERKGSIWGVVRSLRHCEMSITDAVWTRRISSLQLAALHESAKEQIQNLLLLKLNSISE